MRFLNGRSDKPQTGNKPNQNDNTNLNANLRPSPPSNGASQETQRKTETTGGGNQDALSRLATAVAIAETGNCTKGYGKTYNNCFGIKQGRTAPCPKVGRNRMCIYERPEDSYEAFKIIWSKWYRNNPPTLDNAIRWTGNDRPTTWLKHVKANI